MTSDTTSCAVSGAEAAGVADGTNGVPVLPTVWHVAVLQGLEAAAAKNQRATARRTAVPSSTHTQAGVLRVAGVAAWSRLSNSSRLAAMTGVAGSDMNDLLEVAGKDV